MIWPCAHCGGFCACSSPAVIAEPEYASVGKLVYFLLALVLIVFVIVFGVFSLVTLALMFLGVLVLDVIGRYRRLPWRQAIRENIRKRSLAAGGLYVFLTLLFTQNAQIYLPVIGYHNTHPVSAFFYGVFFAYALGIGEWVFGRGARLGVYTGAVFSGACAILSTIASFHSGVHAHDYRNWCIVATVTALAVTLLALNRLTREAPSIARPLSAIVAR